MKPYIYRGTCLRSSHAANLVSSSSLLFRECQSACWIQGGLLIHQQGFSLFISSLITLLSNTDLREALSFQKLWKTCGYNNYYITLQRQYEFSLGSYQFLAGKESLYSILDDIHLPYCPFSFTFCSSYQKQNLRVAYSVSIFWFSFSHALWNLHTATKNVWAKYLWHVSRGGTDGGLGKS